MKKFICVYHNDPDQLSFMKADDESVFGDDIVCEDVTNLDGMYLVRHDDESISVYKCKGNTEDEIRENVVDELREYFDKNPLKGYTDIELDTLGGYTVYVDEDDYDDIDDLAEAVAEDMFEGWAGSYVDGDSESLYEFISFKKDDFEDYYDYEDVDGDEWDDIDYDD